MELSSMHNLGSVYMTMIWVNMVSVVILYTIKTWRLHLSVFTKNATHYFWLFNSILWLSHGPSTCGSCNWMVKIGRCLPSKLPRTAARRINPKNSSRTSCTCCMLGSIFKVCRIRWVWHDNAYRIRWSSCFRCLHQRFPWFHFWSLHLGLRTQKSSFYLCVFIELVYTKGQNGEGSLCFCLEALSCKHRLRHAENHLRYTPFSCCINWTKATFCMINPTGLFDRCRAWHWEGLGEWEDPKLLQWMVGGSHAQSWHLF